MRKKGIFRLAAATAALCLAGITALAAPLLRVTTNKPIYETGERAYFRAKLATRPADDEYEFFVSFKDESGAYIPLALDPTTGDLTGVSTVFEEPGLRTYTGRTWLQHKETAASLIQAIATYESDLRAIDAALAQTQDPVERARLLTERARLETNRIRAVNALASHRKAVGDAAVTTVSVQ